MIKKATFSILFSLMLIAAASTAGFYMGMKKGVEQWVYLTAPTEGIQRVQLLRLLRAGKVDEVVLLIEGQLDSYIISHWDFLRTGRREFLFDEHQRLLRENMYKQMALIAEYKTQFPPNTMIIPRKDVAPETRKYIEHLEEQYSRDMKDALLYYRQPHQTGDRPRDNGSGSQ